jgi:tetratricopeptide (TPR) repeat protein
LGEKNWRVCRTEEPIPGDTAFMTAETDRAELELRDGSRVSLDFDTRLDIAKATEEDSGVRFATLHLRNGKIWLLLTRAQAGMVIYTPTAKAEALGTLFSLSVGRGAAGVHERSEGLRSEAGLRVSIGVLRGAVKLSNQRGTVTVREGNESDVRLDQPPSAPRLAENLATIRRQAPWGQTVFQKWVPERLRFADALARLAGRRAWLGVELGIAPTATDRQPLEPPDLSVTRVAARSPAEKAGIGLGDHLLKLGDLTIRSREDLAKSELLFSPGQGISISVLREGRELRLAATLAEKPTAAVLVTDEALGEANRWLVTEESERAEQAYQKIVDTGQDKAAALNNLGVLYQLNGRVESAVGMFRASVRMSPDVIQYRFNLGMSLYQIGNLQRAAHELEAALALDPAFPHAGFVVGRILALLGESEAAAEQATSLEASSATEAEGYCLRGEISMLVGERDQAESWYLRAADADSSYVDPLIYLGEVYLLQGRLGVAQQWLERALKLDPDSLRALNTLGVTLVRSGHYDRAKEILLRAASANPESGEVRNNLGFVYLKSGDLPASIAAYREAVALAADATACHMGLAMVLERTGRFREAKNEYAVVLRLDPTYPEAYHRLASLHRQLGEAQLATNILFRAQQFGL